MAAISKTVKFRDKACDLHSKGNPPTEIHEELVPFLVRMLLVKRTDILVVKYP